MFCRDNQMRITRTVLGLLFLSLGTLWTLQGSGLIEIKPILCVADCEAVVGPSTKWLLIGLLVAVAGLTIIFAPRLKRQLHSKDNGYG